MPDGGFLPLPTGSASPNLNTESDATCSPSPALTAVAATSYDLSTRHSAGGSAYGALSAGGRNRPRLLDVGCCAGATSRGYIDAGFDVVGVDIAPQPNYPYDFIQASVLDLDPEWVRLNFVAAHGGLPCQGYSTMSNCRPGLAGTYPQLIGPARELFEAADIPYVIENVEAARWDMRNPIMLCGFMFGRELYRHRLFETNWPVVVPEHPAHTIPASKAGHWRPGTVMSVAGHVAPVAKARQVMEIDWTTREELVEAIPPYYISECIGAQLLAVVEERAVA